MGPSARRSPSGVTAIGLFLAVAAYGTWNPVRSSQRAVYPSGWTSPQSIAEKASVRHAAYDLDHYDTIGLYVDPVVLAGYVDIGVSRKSKATDRAVRSRRSIMESRTPEKPRVAHMESSRPKRGAVETQMTARGRAEAYLLLHKLTGSRLGAHYREFLTQDRGREYPDVGSLLSQTLAHAVSTVPYYEGVASLGQIRADPFAALAEFPVLSRDAVRKDGSRLLSSVGDRSKWVENTSGGSTGEPVALLQDPDHLARTVAIREVYSTWAGGRLGSPELYIWGSERDLEQGHGSKRQRVATRLLRRSLLNAFMLTDESILEILESIRTGPPNLVIAYAQAGYEVARYASTHGISLPSQRGLIATAGTLYGYMREQLEDSFGCPVFDRYGSRETGDMAGECEHHRGLHVLPWSCHVEVLGQNDRQVDAGEEGDVVVTGFTNRAMPLIRYRIGDRAKLPIETGVCTCGRDTQMLARITGRTVDMFVGADGRMVDGEYFTHLLYFRTWLRQFQVVQTEPERVVYKVATAGAMPASERDEIADKTRAVLGSDARWTSKRSMRSNPVPPESSDTRFAPSERGPQISDGTGRSDAAQDVGQADAHAGDFANSPAQTSAIDAQRRQQIPS